MAEKTKFKPDAADPAYDTAKKLAINPKADTKNRIEVIRGRDVLTCGAKKKRGPGFCKSFAGQGTQHPGYGRCKYCGGCSTGPTTAEGKAVTAANGVQHGLYSKALSPKERAIYENQTDALAVSLLHEIKALRAKIVVYLENCRTKWEAAYSRKLKEKQIKYKCVNPDCGRTHVMAELAGKPTYCISSTCHERHLTEVERWDAERTHEDAEKYADIETRVFYSDGEGARSFYHAGSLEDRTLDRALNTLSRLIEKHARLNPDGGDDLLGAINAELRAASKGKVSISWGGQAQARNTAEGGVQDGPGTG